MDIHVLDGVLARSFCLLGLALVLQPFWEIRLGRKEFWFPSLRLRRWGLAVSFASGFLLLNTFTLAVGASEQKSIWRFEVFDFVDHVSTALLETQFGYWWLLFFLGLLLLSVTPIKRSFLILAVSMYPLGQMGHTGQHAWPWGAVQAVHMAAVVFWLSGLLFLARRTWPQSLSFESPTRFSNEMLGAMMIILASGLFRAWLVQHRTEEMILYHYLLSGKAMFILVLLLIAARVRFYFCQSFRFSEKEKNWFSWEITLAGWVLFLSTLLSQLPAP